MPRRPSLAVAAFALAIALPLAARAESMELEVNPKVPSGSKEKPTLTVHTVEDASDVVIKLKRSDGKSVTLRTGPIKAGTIKRFTFDVPPGKEVTFTGTVERRSGKIVESLDVSFVAEVVLPTQVSVDPASVDLKAHVLELTSSRKCSKVEVEVTGDLGQELAKATVPFDGAAAGAPLKVRWDQASGIPMRITLRVWDTDGFYQGLELFPWRINIPHEEVNFATGSSRIEPGEEPKLSASLQQIDDAVGKHGQWAKLRLFVAGHTDTVGSAESNRTLSLNRARSIGEWFRRHGLGIPVLVEGFGESSLKVATLDETDEPANRRVEYILAIEPPEYPKPLQPVWKPVR